MKYIFDKIRSDVGPDDCSEDKNADIGADDEGDVGLTGSTERVMAAWVWRQTGLKSAGLTRGTEAVISSWSALSWSMKCELRADRGKSETT